MEIKNHLIVGVSVIILSVWLVITAMLAMENGQYKVVNIVLSEQLKNCQEHVKGDVKESKKGGK